MLSILMPTVWVCFAGYAFWYATLAKHNVPITFNDAEMLWKIHKQNASCNTHKWRPIIRRGGKIVGFECECGFKHIQKRPIVASTPALSS